MRYHFYKKIDIPFYISLFFILSVSLFITGCSESSTNNSQNTHDIINESSNKENETETPSTIPQKTQEKVETDPIQIEESKIAESSTTTSAMPREAKSYCYIPKHDGISTSGNDSVLIDFSHPDQGYFMVQYTGANPKVKLQITGPDQLTYTYDLHSDFEAFPFTAGNGNYQISVFENISGQQYAVAYSESISVSLENEFLPYLYANQYVNFNENSLAVQIAKDLSSTANDDLTIVTNVYNYIISNSSYDHNKASSVQSGYLPVIDDFITTKTGICFDFASTMAAMLRSQGIPTRLEIGYAGDAYHAWISTYLEEKGWVNGIIEFDGVSWKLMDPTFATSSSEESLKKYIGDGSNYITKYRY